jgi:DNA ligase-1
VIAEALFATEGTRARTAKVEALAGALVSVASSVPVLLPFATRFMTGTMLATDDARTLGAGGAIVFEAACRVTGKTPDELGSRTLHFGDLGTAVGEAVSASGRAGEGLALERAEEVAHTLASSGSRSEKLGALVSALAECTAIEARYLVRAVLGEMRVGAKEGIVEDAIAKAFGRALPEVRRAAGIIADVGELARLAHEDRLAEARIVLGRPVGFMLATPIETAKGADLGVPHMVEDKIDGIRAQAHIAPDGVRLFARGKGAVTAAFPDVTRPLEDARLPKAILDGELVVVAADGRPRPFSAIQPRLKKTEPDADLVAQYPVRYLAYDILLEGDEALLGLPFAERRARLVKWAEHAPAPFVLHESRPLASREALDAEFDAARARGFEGLVLKRLDAPYAAGVRGFSWLKVKKAFATLDVVVVAAERGHGKRAGVLSDYTFAVWSESRELEPVGKAYSGLTDEEIRVMTERLRGLALGDESRGWMRVRPEIVLEVAFDGIQRSDRHASGFALRFPRIARIRDDKSPADADTVATVRTLYEAQIASGHREEPAAPKKKGGRKSGRRPDVRQKSKQLKLFDDD